MSKDVPDLAFSRGRVIYTQEFDFRSGWVIPSIALMRNLRIAQMEERKAVILVVLCSSHSTEITFSLFP